MTTTVGRQLKKAMDALDINQVGLSVLSRVDQSTISKLLKGKVSNPGLDLLLSLAHALGVSLDWLATGEMWQPGALDPAEAALVELFRSLPEADRDPLLRIVRAYAEGRSAK